MDSKDYILVDLIGEVVDAMRYTGNITLSIEVSGNYTITSPGHKLTNNEIISLDSNEYKIFNITDDTFDIKDAVGKDFTGLEWKALAPYYEHGHIVEIANTLSAKDQSGGNLRYQKYPLIILFQDYRGSRSISNNAVFADVSANMAIANITDESINAKERYDYNFRDILWPLHDRLMEAVRNIDYFITAPDDAPIDYDFWERVYWGSNLPGENSNVLNDYVDAIELENAQFKIINGIKKC